MNKQRPLVSVILAGLMLWPAGFYAASHREAPITAIDRLADIADFYAFVSYDDRNKVTFVLTVERFWSLRTVPTTFCSIPRSCTRSRSTTTMTRWKTSRSSFVSTRKSGLLAYSPALWGRSTA